MRVRIIHTFPRLIAKPQQGWWRVTAHYTDGKVVYKDYYTFNQTDAKYTFLVEHGRVHGTVDVTFLGEKEN